MDRIDAGNQPEKYLRGPMASVTKQLRAFSLLESVFAMIIIMVCFGIAMNIFNKVTTSSGSMNSIRARLTLQAEATRSKLNNELLDETMVRDGYTIERTILCSPEYPLLKELRLTAKN